LDSDVLIPTTKCSEKAWNPSVQNRSKTIMRVSNTHALKKLGRGCSFNLVTMETPVDATIWDYKNYFDMIEADTFSVATRGGIAVNLG